MRITYLLAVLLVLYIRLSESQMQGLFAQSSQMLFSHFMEVCGNKSLNCFKIVKE